MDSRRRLAVLSSHLRPISCNSHFSAVSASTCASTDVNDDRLNVSKSENQQKDCVFCQIVCGDSPALKLYEDDMCVCIFDTHPLSRGHSLIIPKSHFSSLEATPPSVVAAMCSKVPLIGNAIMKVTDCDSFNLLVNNGAAAGQVIFHTHIHIIPRKAQDCLWASESLKRHRINLDQDTSQLAERVRKQLSKNSNCEDERSSLTEISRIR